MSHQNTKSWEAILSKYEVSLKAANRSPKTIKGYREILRRYFQYLKETGQLKPVENMGKPGLTAYILYLQQKNKWEGNRVIKHQDKPLSPFSVQGYVRAIKVFWSWLTDYNDWITNPLAKFTLPKVPQLQVNILKDDDLTKLGNAINKTTPKGFRDYCILQIFLDTGMRVSEVAGIKLADYDSFDSYVSIIGKGQKQRILPISSIVRKQINKYIKTYRSKLGPDKSPYLFPNTDGKAITSNCIQQMVHRLTKKCHISAKVSPHIFRHTFATKYLANGGQSVYLKEILGHASMVTTNKYTHPQPEDLQRQHELYSPMANLRL
jgi:integrase/recombinase XerD